LAKPVKQLVGPAQKLPPWTGNQRKQECMERWINAKLDELNEEDLERLERELAHANRNAPEWSTIKAGIEEIKLVKALEKAARKDLGPLRELYPRLARYINLPKLEKKGAHFKKDPEQLSISLINAVEDVDRIKAIWKQHYGKQNRPRGQLSALEIAAERHGVELGDIERERSKSPKR